MQAWLRMIWLSGMPTLSTSWAALAATTMAIGSAFPTSSEAQIMMRRAIKRTSSPAYSILAR